MEKGLQTSNIFQLKLIRTVVGREDELVKHLKSKNKNAHYFKTFGYYDLLEMSILNRLYEAIRLDSDHRILNITTLPCFCIKRNNNEFIQSVKTATCPSLILLKLQDQIFENRGISAVYKVASKLHELGKNVFPLIGMGYYEIILWFHAQEFETIFSYIDSIRSLKIKDIIPSFKSSHNRKSALFDSITIPSVSYDNVINTKNWGSLKGKISPIMRLKCQPGYEETISKKLPANCQQLLGSDDLICMWPEAIETGEYLKFILSLRKNTTDYSILDTVSDISNAKVKRSDIGDSADLPSISPPFLKLFEQLADFDKIQKINHFLISELINVVSLFNIYIGNRTLNQNASEIICSLLLYFRGLLNAYESAIETGSDLKIYRLEIQILSYASHIRSSISQQFSSTGYIDVGPQPTFACSLNRIIKAISLIPEQLFGIISKSPVPERLEAAIRQDSPDEDIYSSYQQFILPWYGFAFLDLSDGYRIFDQGEVISVPYKDIFRFLNWITLSHEVSHGYYVRIGFEILETDYLTNILPDFGKDEHDKQLKYRLSWEDTIFELFAHWFDYKHFFNSELDFYTWSIWKTHIEIPRVHQFKLEYWSRSLFVRLSHYWNELKSEMKLIDEKYKNIKDFKTHLCELFKKELDKLCLFIKGKFPNSYDQIGLNNEEKNKVVDRFYEYYDLCRVLEEQYTNRGIIEKVNNRYCRIDRDIKHILSGKVVNQQIENPFLLLREILKSFYNNPGGADEPSDKATVAMIYSLWGSSRKYKRLLPR